MGMREKRENFEKWWGRRVEETSGPVNVYDVEAAWQAATLQAAERMKEEAAKVCKETAWLYKKKEDQKADRFFISQGARELQAAAIRAIDVNKLFGD